ncbi:unnamed protein product, partial [Pleuronectes platessa]
LRHQLEFPPAENMKELREDWGTVEPARQLGHHTASLWVGEGGDGKEEEAGGGVGQEEKRDGERREFSTNNGPTETTEEPLQFGPNRSHPSLSRLYSVITPQSPPSVSISDTSTPPFRTRGISDRLMLPLLRHEIASSPPPTPKTYNSHCVLSILRWTAGEITQVA